MVIYYFKVKDAFSRKADVRGKSRCGSQVFGNCQPVGAEIEFYFLNSIEDRQPDDGFQMFHVAVRLFIPGFHIQHIERYVSHHERAYLYLFGNGELSASGTYSACCDCHIQYLHSAGFGYFGCDDIDTCTRI